MLLNIFLTSKSLSQFFLFLKWSHRNFHRRPFGRATLRLRHSSVVVVVVRIFHRVLVHRQFRLSVPVCLFLLYITNMLVLSIDKTELKSILAGNVYMGASRCCLCSVLYYAGLSAGEIILNQNFEYSPKLKFSRNRSYLADQHWGNIIGKECGKAFHL